ncbi:MAG: helix-turn-helix domain-containing protein [Verrucomicrobia bacterium]|nr:helix-turn-helix domain-containing protein [Verrucomicrobiota bacterium]
MQTIGERLEEARKRKGISIREAAEATKIRGDYLHKYESNQFDLKLPEIYVRGFLRLYGNFLKLPGDKLVADYLALGLGEGGRPAGRGLNREIYGKIEITHSGSSAARSGSAEPAPSGAAAAMTPGAEPVSKTPQRAPFQPRMPLGGLDRALLAKNGVWIGVGAVAVLALVIWGVASLFSGGSKPAAVNAASPVPAMPVEESVYIVAQRPVQITAIRAKADNRELAAPVSLVAGQSYPLPNVAMLVSVSDRAAVQFEFKKVRYNGGVNVTGPGTLSLDFSAQR